jgi:hypothetical protein
MFMDFFNLGLHLQRHLDLGLQYVPETTEIKLEDFFVKILHGVPYGSNVAYPIYVFTNPYHLHFLFSYNPYHA